VSFTPSARMMKQWRYRAVCLISRPLLSAPLRGGRVLELHREGRGYRVAVVQLDGKDRRQAGGITLEPDDMAVFASTVRAIATYVRGAA
jgi:hypothetical protein